MVDLLKEIALIGVECSFNKTMHKQTDVVAIGYPLSPVFANISVDSYENKFYSNKETTNLIINWFTCSKTAVLFIVFFFFFADLRKNKGF